MTSLHDALALRVEAMHTAGTATRAAEMERLADRLRQALDNVDDGDMKTCDVLADALETVRDTAHAALLLLRSDEAIEAGRRARVWTEFAAAYPAEAVYLANLDDPDVVSEAYDAVAGGQTLKALNLSYEAARRRGQTIKATEPIA